MLESMVNGKLPFPCSQSAVCLWGTYGTGKTTLAQMLPGFLEATGNLIPSTRQSGMWGSTNYWNVTSCGQGTNGVSVMQGITERANTDVHVSPKGYFYEILDEVDLLTPAAQATLKSAITFAKGTIFILTTNHFNKLDGGLRDRSIMVEMNMPSLTDMEAMGRRFLQQMGLTGNELTTAQLHQLAQQSRGSLRQFGSAILVAGLSLGGVMP